MRISEDRYQRDRQRHDLAIQFIEREARTHTICEWTGLTPDRIRKLLHSYLAHARLKRYRGQSPHRITHFMHTVPLRAETSFLGSLCACVGLVPSAPSPAPWRPTMERGFLLCRTFDAYRLLQAPASISFEYTIFLMRALCEQNEIELRPCQSCGALLAMDKYGSRRAQCTSCSPHQSMPRPCAARSNARVTRKVERDVRFDDARPQLAPFKSPTGIGSP